MNVIQAGLLKIALAYLAILLMGFGLGWLSCALADDSIPGPIRADVISVYDGDTVTVDAHSWPGERHRTAVRVRGVDTPEIRGKCAGERRAAKKARDFTRRFVGGSVVLRHIERGKYAGRIVADVFVKGRSLAEALIEAELGRAYDGGRREGWC